MVLVGEPTIKLFIYVSFFVLANITNIIIFSFLYKKNIATIFLVIVICFNFVK